MYYKPDQGMFATPRDPQFLTAAISKNSSQTPVSVETQRNIAEAIFSGGFGNPISQAVALAIEAKLDAFTDPEAQRSIFMSISGGKFGTPIPEAVALAIATKRNRSNNPILGKGKRSLNQAVVCSQFQGSKLS